MMGVVPVSMAICTFLFSGIRETCFAFPSKVFLLIPWPSQSNCCYKSSFLSYLTLNLFISVIKHTAGFCMVCIMC